jgi:hypothetical protein
LANKKPYLRAVLDDNAIIQEFESTLGIECYNNCDVIGKNWFDIFIDSRDYEKVMSVFRSLFDRDEKKWETYANDIKCKNKKHILIDFKNSIEIREGKKYLVFVGTEHYLN